MHDLHALRNAHSPSDTVRLLLKSPPVTAALAALGGLLAACGVPDPWQLTDPHGPPAILMFDGLVGDVASDEEFANAVRWADAVFGAQPRFVWCSRGFNVAWVACQMQARSMQVSLV